MELLSESLDRPLTLFKNQYIIITKDYTLLNFQIIVMPDGLALHVDCALKGRRHDHTIWKRSNLDEQLESVLNHSDVQYRIYGDSAYTKHPCIEFSRTGLNLTDTERNESKNRSASRVTVEWFFKEVNRYWLRCDFKRSLRILEHLLEHLLRLLCY